jgi:hypothetical protein
MEKDLPYPKVSWGIAVLRDPSSNKPNDSSFDDEIAMQGTSVSQAVDGGLSQRTLHYCVLLHLLQSPSTKTGQYCLLNDGHTAQLRSRQLLSVQCLAGPLADVLPRLVNERSRRINQSSFLPLTLVNALTSRGITNSRYWFAKVMRTRSAHGYRNLKRVNVQQFGLTRISNCHCSSSLSSVLTHSSGLAIQPSRSFGLSGMKRVTKNVTAVSTKS